MFHLYYDWLEDVYWPVMGREGEEDDPAPAGGGDDPAPADDPAPGAAGGDEDPEDADNPEDNDDDDEPPDELDRIRAELESSRKELASAQVAVRKAKADARKAREDAAKTGGNWEAVAKEREAEIADANERAQAAERDRLEATESLDRFQRTVRVTNIATRLSYRDPEDAIALLKDDETGDDKVAERALRRLAERKPYLVDQKRARGRALSDNGGGNGLTYDQIKGMSQDEINANWDGVQKVLAEHRARGG